jgi:5-hydroxyisourate hydrolase
VLAEASTDGDGRVGSLGEDLAPGDYRIRFETGAWFTDAGVEAFYPEVAVSFTIDADEHFHVPLLLSPFGYSTYRGS